MSNQNFEKAYNAFKIVSKFTFNSELEFLTAMARNGFPMFGYTKSIFLSNIEFNYGKITPDTLRKYSKRLAKKDYFENNFVIAS
jgi:hypothetical protein